MTSQDQDITMADEIMPKIDQVKTKQRKQFEGKAALEKYKEQRDHKRQELG